MSLLEFYEQNQFDYVPIEDYGIIGDLRTCALISKYGSIDWFCLPNFDSGSVFAAILDKEKGGYFKIQGSHTERFKQMYFPETNILITRFLNDEGVGEVVDYMPIQSRGMELSEHKSKLVRKVNAVRGHMRFKMECFPAIDYGRQKHTIHILKEHHILFRSRSMNLELKTPYPVRIIDGKKVFCEFELRAGETCDFIFQEYHTQPSVIDMKLDVAFSETMHYWQRWVSKFNYYGRWREMVLRSALVLKLLTYQPTGAIIAAPTTSLPEKIGGRRNWDYRYTWIRDASFTINSLLAIGFTEEAEQFMSFLEKLLTQLEDQDYKDYKKVPLGLLYRIDGSQELDEYILEHFEGYRKSRPVRIGNAAHHQLQLDIFGALLDAIYLYDNYARSISYDLWHKIVGIVNWLCKNWDKEDEGIWEVRSGKRHFVYSKMMCWVALDRAIRISEKHGYPCPLFRWIQTRNRIFSEILKKGWSVSKKAFVQAYESKNLDASILLMPIVGFLDAKDPRIQSTVDQILKELVSDSLVFRYNVSETQDGFIEDEGTFSICTFWLAEVLARADRIDEARIIFEKMLSYSNHLGLYSEEIGVNGEALGNYPQAFTHIGLIRAAYYIDHSLESYKDKNKKVL